MPVCALTTTLPETETGTGTSTAAFSARLPPDMVSWPPIADPEATCTVPLVIFKPPASVLLPEITSEPAPEFTSCPAPLKGLERVSTEPLDAFTRIEAAGPTATAPVPSGVPERTSSVPPVTFVPPL